MMLSFTSQMLRLLADSYGSSVQDNFTRPFLPQMIVSFMQPIVIATSYFRKAATV